MSSPTKLKKAKMPRWLWQLRQKGFHLQLKKYAHFLWKQRPEGCNWSRQLRARYFNRSIRTISYWDAFLIKHHLAWIHNKGEMLHRIGARPYYSKDVWQTKAAQKSLPPTRATNCTPYTAQQKNNLKGYSSSADAAAKRRQQQTAAEPSADANSTPAKTNRRHEIRGSHHRKEN